jgi:hypothetical protein
MSSNKPQINKNKTSLDLNAWDKGSYICLFYLKSFLGGMQQIALVLLVH